MPWGPHDGAGGAGDGVAKAGGAPLVPGAGGEEVGTGAGADGAVAGAAAAAADDGGGDPAVPYFILYSPTAAEDGEPAASDQAGPELGRRVRPCLPGWPVLIGADARRVFAIDIETTGVERDCALTCVCTWDGALGRTWFFRTPAESDESKAEIMARMDAAEFLLAFGGARFDLPVLARCFEAGPAVLGAWMRKLVDPLYVAPVVLGVGSGQKLDEFLRRNGMPGKSGSGAHAVELARDGRWDELGDYCLDDARLTYEAIMARGWWADGVRYDPWCERGVFRLCDRADDGAAPQAGGDEVVV